MQPLSRAVYRLSNALLPATLLRHLRTRNEWRRWVDSLSSTVLVDLTGADRSIKRDLFRAHVARVEVEAHAKCNRVCDFCPNSLVDRRRNDRLTDRSVLDHLFAELSEIDYSRQIIVARYSEPLANLASLYECLARARAAVPHAELGITTNTDYLKREVLDRLADLGLNVLYMSLYLRDNERWSPEFACEYTDRLATKLALSITRKTVTATTVSATFAHHQMRVQSTCHDWSRYGTNRGGTLAYYSVTPRLGPCRDPFETFVMDYDGSVVPCCAIRSDVPSQRELVVANLAKPGASIFDIYAEQLSAWRKSLVDFGPKAAPCTTCSHRDVPAALVSPVSRMVRRRLLQIRGTQ